MNAYLSEQDAGRIHSIAPLNVSYIFDTLPHRKYNYPEGGIFEISVQLLSSHSKGGRVGIIGMSYQEDHKSEIHVETYILHENGTIYGYDPENGKIEKTIRLAHLYMLLNPTDVGGWKLSQPQGELYRTVGLDIEDDHIVEHSQYLLLQMKKVQGLIGKIL